MDVSEIINRLGGASAACRRLRLKRTTVQMWRSRGRLPHKHVPAVAAALGVPAEAVWPALTPSEGPAPSHAQPEQVAA